MRRHYSYTPGEFRLEGRTLYRQEPPRDRYGRFTSRRREVQRARAANECLTMALALIALAVLMGGGWLTVALTMGAFYFWGAWLMLLPRRPRRHRGLARVALAWAGRAVGRWAVRTTVRLAFVWPARLVVRTAVAALGVLGALQLALTRAQPARRTFTAGETAQWSAVVAVDDERRRVALARLEQLEAEQRAVRDTIDVAAGVLTTIDELHLLFSTRRDHSAFTRRLEGYWVSTLTGERRHDALCALEQAERPEWAVDLLAAWAYRNQPMD